MRHRVLNFISHSQLKKFVFPKVLFLAIFFASFISSVKAINTDSSSQSGVRIVKNAQVQVTISLSNNNLSFEVVRGKVKYKVTAVNEIGQISFTNTKSILSYLGNAFTRVDYVLHKTEFLLFPVKDESGKLIFYRVALDLDHGTSTSALPYLMMKGQSALFNQKTAKMLVYEQIKQENYKTKKVFFVTNFNIYHLDKSENENYREFYSTEKSTGIPSNLTPLALKVKMMDLLIDFMPNYTIESYFR